MSDNTLFTKNVQINDLSMTNDRKRKIDLDTTNIDSYKFQSETGRGKRIKKPLNKYDHLGDFMDFDIFNGVIKRKENTKTNKKKENIDYFLSKPSTSNVLISPIDIKPENNNFKLIDNITNNLSKMHGKTYQELKVIDEDGKEEEIFVVDVSTEDELDIHEVNSNTKYAKSKKEIGNFDSSPNIKNISLEKDLFLHKGHNSRDDIRLDISNLKNQSSQNSPNHLKINVDNYSFFNSLTVPNNNDKSLKSRLNADEQLLNILCINNTESNCSKNLQKSFKEASNLKNKLVNDSKINVNKNRVHNNILNKDCKKLSNKQIQFITKNLNGPFIEVKKNKTLQVYQLVNSKDQCNSSSLSTFSSININECSSIFSCSKMSDCIPWRCIFCMHPSSYSFLGDLFGPYYMKSQLNDSISNKYCKNTKKKKVPTATLR